jgi:hypothetical protein
MVGIAGSRLDSIGWVFGYTQPDTRLLILPEQEDMCRILLQPEWINVVITRPRLKLIILGSRHLLRSRLPDPDL